MTNAIWKRAGARRGIAAAALVAGLTVPAVVGAQGPAPPPYQLPQEPIADEPARPSLRKRAVIVPVSGLVRWAPPRRPSRRLLRRTGIPLGSTVDTRRGRVRVIVSRGGGRRWRGEFYDGRFRIEQSEPGRELVTSLILVGGSFEETCGPPAAEETARSARRRNRRVRRLWGDGKGRFRTRGRYSAATVRGTKWLVADRCEDTLTRVARGEVEVEDFTLARGEAPAAGGPEAQDPAAAPAPQSAPGNVRLRRGGSYSARPDD